MLSSRALFVQIQDAAADGMKRLDDLRCDRCWHWVQEGTSVAVGECSRMRSSRGKPADEVADAYAVARGDARVRRTSEFACSMWEPKR